MHELNRRTFIAQSTAAAASWSLLGRLAHAQPAPPDGPLSAAVIGAGRQGRSILGELQKLEAVKVAAICDVDERRLSSGQRRAADAAGFDDHRRLLDERPDISLIFIATPTHLHRQVAVDALQAGRNVYCEAPLAHSVEDARAIVDAARSTEGVFQAGYQARSNPIYGLARTFYRSDAIRDLVGMRAQHHRKTTWRSPARDPQREKELNWRLDPERSLGLAGELGSHQFDVTNWYLEQYPVRITGMGGVMHHHDGREVYDTVGCELLYPDKKLLQYHATIANSFEGRYEVFYGSNSAIKLAWTAGWMFKEADAPTQGWEVYANRQQFHNDEGITLIADATQLAAQGRLKEGVGLPNPPLWYALGDFLTSVIEGAPPACSAAEGYRSTVVGILANEAVRSNGPVDVDPDLLRAG